MDAALIDALTEKFAALLATLAVESSPLPRLAHVPDLLFEALAGELHRGHGFAQPVVADALGLTPRGLQTKLARLDGRRRGSSIAGTVLRELHRLGPRSRAQLEQRFGRQDGRMVSSVLRHLVRAHLVTMSGAGASAVYALNRHGAFDDGEPAHNRRLVWVAVYDNPGVDLQTLADRLGVGTPHLDRLAAVLADLVEHGHVTAEGEGPEARFAARDFVITFDEPDGRHAALLDHLGAVLDVVIMEARAHRGVAAPTDGPVGGNTVRLDLFEGHPASDEARATYKRLRRELTALRETIDATRPAQAPVGQMVIYVGSSTTTTPTDGGLQPPPTGASARVGGSGAAE